MLGRGSRFVRGGAAGATFALIAAVVLVREYDVLLQPAEPMAEVSAGDAETMPASREAMTQPTARDAEPSATRSSKIEAARPARPEVLAQPQAAKPIAQTRQFPQDLLPTSRLARDSDQRANAQLIVLTQPPLKSEQIAMQQRIPQGFPVAAATPVARPASQTLDATPRIPALARSDKAIQITRPALVVEAVIEEERTPSAPPQIAALPAPGDVSAPNSDAPATRLDPPPPLTGEPRQSDPEIVAEAVVEDARSDTFGPALMPVALRLDAPASLESEKSLTPSQPGRLTDYAMPLATPSALEPSQADEMVPVSFASFTSELPAAPRPGGMSLTIISKGVLRGLRKSPADLLGLNEESRPAAQKCLANAIYFESRGEPLSGQIAVAQVVLNRAFSGFYPRDICGVVYQNAERRMHCQFTFACDGKADTIRDNDAWGRADRIAREMLEGQLWIEDVGKSTHYHAHWVAPSWVSYMKAKIEIGVHTFYRPRAWGDGARAPSWGEDNMSSLVPVSGATPW